MDPESHPALWECQQGIILYTQRERWNSLPLIFSTVIYISMRLIDSFKDADFQTLHLKFLMYDIIAAIINSSLKAVLLPFQLNHVSMLQVPGL